MDNLEVAHAAELLNRLREMAERLRTTGVDPTETPRRRIAVVTTSRADYSHLYWPLRELAANRKIELGLFTLGAHHSPEFGHTIREIERDGFPIVSRIECLLSSDSDTGMAKTIGLATLGLADALTQWRPDLLLLIADRYEMLAPASVALALRIPVAHIEGGEISQGAIDDAVRNAITKLAHIHFTSTATARRRVIAMGEEPWRVHHAGAPSLDHLTRSTLYSRAELESLLTALAGHEIKLKKPSVLVAFHPTTILADTTSEAEEFFAALDSLNKDSLDQKIQRLFVYPNSDAGSRSLIELTHALKARRDSRVGNASTEIFLNLPPLTYWSLMARVDAMVGNSSSGIMEAASFALPVVNVGIRQQGRERAPNIIDTPADRNEILAAIQKSLSPDFRASLTGIENPYGNGTAAVKIAEVLSTVNLEGILIKAPTPLPEASS
jgi:UDP-hydrolysing UDP-N-acetyl-D-glucosamine 2-epimerase